MKWQAHPDRLFIEGEWTASRGTERIEVISPSTEDRVALVASASVDDIDHAVAVSRRAFESGPWPRMSLHERIAIMRRVVGELEDGLETVAHLITEEMGCPITQSRTIQVPAAINILKAAIETAAVYPFEERRHSFNGEALLIREPIGVVAAVVPWNMPLASAMHKLAPALLSGCTFLLKPASETPLDAFWLADAFSRAGLPPGVFAVLPTSNGNSEYLISHPGVDKVSFTGSTRTGRRIASIAGGDLRRYTLELGGKSAAIILDDADLGVVSERLRLGSFRNSGQVCSLKTRVVVSRSRHDELVDRLIDMVGSMQVGDPMDPLSEVGPMVSRRQRETVENYIAIGQQEGATLAFGGGRPPSLEHGWYVSPTIFTDVDPDATIAQEEIFGPVVSVITSRNEEDAIQIANNSPYGLNGAVFTTDLERGLAVARQIRTGTVELNGNPAGSSAPMGGFKDSGIGREGGAEGFAPYLEIKSIGLPSAAGPS